MQGRSFELKATDGRTLRARVAGPEDGGVIVYLPGTPGTDTVYCGQLEQGAKRSLRHLCCLRPGYGGSDRLPGRSVAASAADVAAVADSLAVDRFYVLGHSGGAPYALACAALLPDRVIAAAAVSGFAPPREMGEGWRDGVAAMNLEEFDAAAGDEAGHARIIERYFEEWRQLETLDELRESFREFYSGNDLEALMMEGNLQYQLDCIHRIAREEVWGWLDDDRAAIADWGFAVEDIRAPVSIWHGEEDPGLPASHATWLADRIPSARLHRLSGEGHISILYGHYGSMLDELIELGAERR
jgi:pimeloyl-ACP methyl ester carboxylesterase